MGFPTEPWYFQEDPSTTAPLLFCLDTRLPLPSPAGEPTAPSHLPKGAPFSPGFPLPAPPLSLRTHRTLRGSPAPLLCPHCETIARTMQVCSRHLCASLPPLPSLRARSQLSQREHRPARILRLLQVGPACHAHSTERTSGVPLARQQGQGKQGVRLRPEDKVHVPEPERSHHQLTTYQGVNYRGKNLEHHQDTPPRPLPGSLSIVGC
jgi:hypothetical protein